MPTRALRWIACSLALACEATARGGGFEVDGTDGAPGTSSGATTGGESTSGAPDPGDDTTTTTTSGSGDVTTADFVFDLGDAPDVGAVDDSCRAVDFLFVVDNSMSMEDHQANLTANFGDFIVGIESTLDQVDSYHVGVVTSDAYVHNEIGCNTLGALVTWTGGPYSSASHCVFAEGHRYMTEADDLPAAFACAATVGTEGDWSERPMEAMTEALAPPLSARGACNDGFVRDDALLVIIVISDEPEGPGDPEGPPPDSSVGDPQSWYDAVVAAKQGLSDNVVVMTLVHEPDPASDHMTEFATMFGENGFPGHIWGDYNPLFQQAIGIIDQACDDFVAG